MSVLDKPTRFDGRPMLHTPQARRNLHSLGGRRREQWCEAVMPGARSGTSGYADEPDVKLGRFVAAIAPVDRGREEFEEGVDRERQYEIATAPTIVLPANARVAVPAFFEAWQAATEYAAGQHIKGGELAMGSAAIFECIVGGTSGDTEPAWNLTGITEDAEISWRMVGVVTYYEISMQDATRSNQIENVHLAKVIE